MWAEGEIPVSSHIYPETVPRERLHLIGPSEPLTSFLWPGSPGHFSNLFSMVFRHIYFILSLSSQRGLLPLFHYSVSVFCPHRLHAGEKPGARTPPLPLLSTACNHKPWYHPGHHLPHQDGMPQRQEFVSTLVVPSYGVSPNIVRSVDYVENLSESKDLIG